MLLLWLSNLPSKCLIGWFYSYLDILLMLKPHFFGVAFVMAIQTRNYFLMYLFHIDKQLKWPLSKTNFKLSAYFLINSDGTRKQVCTLSGSVELTNPYVSMSVLVFIWVDQTPLYLFIYFLKLFKEQNQNFSSVFLYMLSKIDIFQF